MAEGPARTTAKIIQFPVKGRLPIPRPEAVNRTADALWSLPAEAGGAWYHEAALQEAATPDSSTRLR